MLSKMKQTSVPVKVGVDAVGVSQNLRHEGPVAATTPLSGYTLEANPVQRGESLSITAKKKMDSRRHTHTNVDASIALPVLLCRLQHLTHAHSSSATPSSAIRPPKSVCSIWFQFLLYLSVSNTFCAFGRSSVIAAHGAVIPVSAQLGPRTAHFSISPWSAVCTSWCFRVHVGYRGQALKRSCKPQRKKTVITCSPLSICGGFSLRHDGFQGRTSLKWCASVHWIPRFLRTTAHASSTQHN